MLIDTTSPSCIHFVHLACHTKCCYDVARIWRTRVPSIFMLCLCSSWSIFDKSLIIMWLVRLTGLVLHGLVSQYPRVSVLRYSGHGLHRFPRSQCHGQQTRAIGISVLPVTFMSLRVLMFCSLAETISCVAGIPAVSGKPVLWSGPGFRSGQTDDAPLNCHSNYRVN